jgi:hypothetical protein
MGVEFPTRWDNFKEREYPPSISFLHVFQSGEFTLLGAKNGDVNRVCHSGSQKSSQRPFYREVGDPNVLIHAG